MHSQAGPLALVIENDSRLASAVAQRLRIAGIRCLTAGNGAQGVSLFDKNVVDVVVTDLLMPQGDGVSVVQAIRRQSDVPIIVMTGYSDLFDHDCGNVRGVTHLPKPVDHGMLLSHVLHAIGGPSASHS